MTQIKIYQRHYDDLNNYKKIFDMFMADQKEDIESELSQLEETGGHLTISFVASLIRKSAYSNYQNYDFFKEPKKLFTAIEQFRLLCELYKLTQMARSLPDGESLSLNLFETEIVLEGLPISSWPNRPSICNELSLAIIMRDQTCIDALLTYTIENVAEVNESCYTKLAQMAYLEYVYTAMQEEIDHQAIHNKNMPIMDELLEGDYRFRLSLWRALGQLNQDKDLDAFEQAVIESFQAQSHIQKNDRELNFHLLPVMLVAPVCIAHDKYGYVPQHQNDYLPKWLLSGKFEKGIAEAE
ncbi:hypothetical protein JL49_24335 [Pseudoalteromonas luteoviolacea]|nr:hypothetical protein JL49_24335 [Pseudoalteromonas luteoviolacea]